MRVKVEQTALPGIGVRHDLLTAKGRRIGVISFRSGRRDFITFDPDDEDSCRESIELNDDEAQALADILGASIILGELAQIREQAAGLRTEQITIAAGSPFVERTLGQTEARSRTGASIVAVLRGGGVIPSPDPQCVFHAGDVVVVVGTPEGVEGVQRIFADGPVGA
jgi:K+:H+ antiporter subunit KhtT